MPASRMKRATCSAIFSRSGLRVISRGAGDDLRRVADRGHLDHVVHVVALDLPGHAGEGNQVVGDHDDVVGVHGIGQREAERAARRLAQRAGGVAEGVGRGRGDDGDVDVHLAVLDRLPASAVRAQHAQAAHLALRAVVAQRPVHRALDVMDDAGFHQLDHRRLRRKRRAGKPHQVADAHARRGLERHQRDRVAIAQVMVVGDGHAVAQAAFAQCGLEIGHALVAVGGIFAR